MYPKEQPSIVIVMSSKRTQVDLTLRSFRRVKLLTRGLVTGEPNILNT